MARKIFKVSGYLISTAVATLSPLLDNKFYNKENIESLLSHIMGTKAQHIHVEESDVPDEEYGELLEDNCDLAFCEKYFHTEPQTKELHNRVVKVGERYKHFKTGKIVKVIAIAQNTESVNSFSVVYQCGDDSTDVWSRPYDMFVSPTDKEKYPEATQYWRFEKVEE